jgi:O-antigen ligase
MNKTQLFKIFFAVGFALLLTSLALPAESVFRGFHSVVCVLAFLAAWGGILYQGAEKFPILHDKTALIALLFYCLMSFGIVVSVLANDSTPEIFAAIRQHLIFPFVFALLGYFLAGFHLPAIQIALISSGAFNMIVGFLAITTTPLVRMASGNWAGGMNRIWMHPLSGQEFWATVVLMNSVGAGLAGLLALSSKSRFLQAASIASMAAFAGIGLMSGTRGGLVAVGLAVLLLVLRLLILHEARIKVALYLMIVAGIVFYSAAAFPAIMAHASRFVPEELFDKTATGRTDVWAGRLGLILEKPLGVGFEASLAADGFSAHNMYIECLFSYGWIGGLGFLGICMTLAWVVFRSLTGIKPRMEVFGLAACVLAMLIYGMAEAIMRSSLQAFFLFYLVSGAFLRVWHAHQRMKEADPRAASLQGCSAVFKERRPGFSQLKT